MTDKQIIIYKKECYNEPHCSLNQVLEQLKRKEQECEELKEQLKEMNEVIRTETTRCNLVNILKTELDQLKEQLEAYKMEADEGKEINAELKAENEEWKKANDYILTTLNVIAEGNKKLRQTLTEIKEIAEKGHKEKGNLMRTWWFKDILQKISEVEDA